MTTDKQLTAVRRLVGETIDLHALLASTAIATKAEFLRRSLGQSCRQSIARITKESQ